jgi:hypothetical protein
MIENLTTGEKVVALLGSDNMICEKDAEWNVELWIDDDTEAPIIDFGTIKFSDAKASSASVVSGPLQATIRNAYQGNNALTSVTTDSTSVTVQYLGK